MEGWIKIHRKLLDNPIASNPALIGFFCYLLLKVSHKQNTFYLGNEKIIQKPGQGIISQKKLAKEFNVSIGTISRWLDVMQNETIIETKGTNKYTVLTILNRDKYQNDGNLNENKMKTDGNLTETIKNEKNEKNEKKKELKEKFLDKVYLKKIEYENLINDFGKKIVDDKIEELNYGIINKGYKYKEHNLTLRKWIKKDGIKKVNNNKSYIKDTEDSFFTSINKKIGHQ